MEFLKRLTRTTIESGIDQTQYFLKWKHAFQSFIILCYLLYLDRIWQNRSFEQIGPKLIYTGLGHGHGFHSRDCTYLKNKRLDKSVCLMHTNVNVNCVLVSFKCTGVKASRQCFNNSQSSDSVEITVMLGGDFKSSSQFQRKSF